MRESERLFRETAPVRLFLTAAVPGAIGMLVSSLYGVLDGVFVGNFIGESAFAAINLAMPFVIVNFAFGDLIGVGSAVPISIAHGRGERDRANNIFTCACIMNIVCGLVTGLVFLVLAPHLMAAMGAVGELAAQATLYLRVYALFLPLTSIGFAADNYLKICGRIRRSMVSNVLLAVGGAAIEYVLLGVFHLGVGAAALSFCLAIMLAVVVALRPFFRGELDLVFVSPHFSPSLVRAVVSAGFPVFLENVAGRVTSVVLNVALLAQGGADAVSIYGVAMFCDGVITPLIYGTLDALQPAVGFNWGAGDLTRVARLEACCFVASALICLTSFVVVLLGHDQITLLFLPAAEDALVDEAAWALSAFACSLLVRWLPFAAQAFMVAVGQARLATIVTVSQALGFPLLALIMLAPWGLRGLWLNMAVSSACSTVLTLGVLGLFWRTARARLAYGTDGGGVVSEYDDR